MGPVVIYYVLISIPLIVVALISTRKSPEEKKQAKLKRARIRQFFTRPDPEREEGSGWKAESLSEREEIDKWKGKALEKRKLKRKQQRISRLIPLIHAFIALAIIVAILEVYVQIVLFSRELGPFFVPAVIIYVAVLALIGWILNHKKEKLSVRGMVDDDLYYSMYPVDRFFHEKKEAIRNWWAERNGGRGDSSFVDSERRQYEAYRNRQGKH